MSRNQDLFNEIEERFRSCGNRFFNIDLDYDDFDSLVGFPKYHVFIKRNCNEAEIAYYLESLGCSKTVAEQQNNTKTAFLTRDDQNQTLIEILTSSYRERIMEWLNCCVSEVVVKIPTDQLMTNKNLMMTKECGDVVETIKANSVCLLIGPKLSRPEGDYLRVKTFYPSEEVLKEDLVDVSIF